MTRPPLLVTALASILSLSLIGACGSGSPGGGGGDDEPGPTDSGGSGDGQPSDGMVFEPDVTRVVIEIDYEQGEAPYTGPIVGFGDTFDPSLANINRLLANRKTLTLPTTLGAMENLGAIPDEERTVADILAIAAAHRQQQDGGGQKSYYIVFLSGLFTDGGGPRNGVLGVSIGNTGVIAMFKDVIRTTENIALPNQARFTEQTTLIHEFGHAIGLVDNGVPMLRDHKDEPHGAHSSNDQCVMYYLVESAADAAAYATRSLGSNNTILFDADCLADVDALSGGLAP